MKWNPHNEYQFYCGTETGVVCLYDARNDEKALFTLCAYPGTAVTGLAPSLSLSGCLATSGDDTLTLWDTRDHKSPRAVYNHPMSIGQLTSVEASPDAAAIFAIAGDRQFRIVDLAKDLDVCQAFDLTPPKGKKSRKPSNKDEVVVGGGDEDVEGDDDEDGGQSKSSGITVIDGKALARMCKKNSKKTTDTSSKEETQKVTKKIVKKKKKIAKSASEITKVDKQSIEVKDDVEKQKKNSKKTESKTNDEEPAKKKKKKNNNNTKKLKKKTEK